MSDRKGGNMAEEMAKAQGMNSSNYYHYNDILLSYITKKIAEREAVKKKREEKAAKEGKK